jgi:hypothetical protein
MSFGAHFVLLASARTDCRKRATRGLSRHREGKRLESSAFAGVGRHARLG